MLNKKGTDIKRWSKTKMVSIVCKTLRQNSHKWYSNATMSNSQTTRRLYLRAYLAKRLSICSRNMLTKVQDMTGAAKTASSHHSKWPNAPHSKSVKVLPTMPPSTLWCHALAINVKTLLAVEATSASLEKDQTSPPRAGTDSIERVAKSTLPAIRWTAPSLISETIATSQMS